MSPSNAFQAWKAYSALVKELEAAVRSPDYNHSPPSVSAVYP